MKKFICFYFDFFFQFVEFTDFVELVWKRCQLYVRMRSQPCYSLACHALRNLINQASTYNKFTTERIKTMCLFFKVNYVGWAKSFMYYYFDGRSLLQDKTTMLLHSAGAIMECFLWEDYIFLNAMK